MGAALAGRGEPGRVNRRGSDALTGRERDKSCNYAAGFWAETPLLKNTFLGLLGPACIT